MKVVEILISKNHFTHFNQSIDFRQIVASDTSTFQVYFCMITLHIGFLSPRLLPLLCAKTHTQLFCQLTQSQVVTKQLCMLRSVTSDLFSYSITFPLSLLPIHEVIICCSRTDLYLHSYSTHTHMHKTGSKNYDVAVIGAGISGKSIKSDQSSLIPSF